MVDHVGDDLGTVAEVNAARTCALVESGKSLLRRAKTHGLHVCAVDHVDLDAFTISLTVGAADVARAPECHELDADGEAALARYYGELR